MSNVKRALMTLVLVVGIGLGAGYLAHDWLADYLVQAQPVKVTKVAVQQTKQKADSANNYDFEAVKPLSLTQISRMSVRRGHLPVIGKVVIPSVKLNLPISRGVEPGNLAFSAGTLKPNQQIGTGNYAIAGHHMANNDRILFGPLVRTRIGTRIYVTDMTKVAVYQVWQRKYIAANQLAVIKDQKDQQLVTMVTCDDTGDGRLMVQGKLVETTQFSKLSSALQKELKATK